MRITPLDVHEQTFRVSFRGFDPGEVDGFLQRVADEIERLIEERDAAREELDAERETRRSLDAALAAARDLQTSLLEQSRAEAETVRNQAQLQADRILAGANEELLRLRREIQQARERRSLWLAELGALADTLTRWVDERSARPSQDPDLISGRGGEEAWDGEGVEPQGPGDEASAPDGG
ncbi:MAG: DivIVA domain-containing protein [Deferrisomatales bacterium]|nr:DivIVA domain-containing protein [Deferrisomatales bacterium]